METRIKKKSLDYNIRRIIFFVQLPPLDVFALTLIKHGVPGLLP
jgi:hypothetical protein